MALETIILIAKGFVEDSAKVFLEESAEDFIEELPDIFLPKTQIHEQITKISKENTFKRLGNKPWL